MNGEGVKLRLFVAFAVPPDVKARLAIVQEELRCSLSREAVSWTRLENTHLTLRFLGNVDVNQVEALSANLANAASGFGSLRLISERLGCFPDLRYPRVLWAGVHDAEDRLADLQRRVVQAAAEFTTEPPEKSFTGHITLARIKRIKRPQAEAIAAFVNGAAVRQFGEWTADRIELLRSELRPEGSRYTTISSAAL